MVKYLSALKRKKGFTIVELVVVIAIIAVLVAVSASAMLNRDSNKVVLASSNAQSFMTAMQMTMTKAQFTERKLVSYSDDDATTPNRLIEYKDGANTIAKYLFIEVKYDSHGIDYLHVDDKINELMGMSEAKAWTMLEKHLRGLVDTYMAESYEGYFYAMVNSDFRVECTHFSEVRLPAYTSGGNKYRDSLMFSEGGYINRIAVGSCSDDLSVGAKGTYCFDLPESGDDYYA